MIIIINQISQYKFCKLKLRFVEHSLKNKLHYLEQPSLHLNCLTITVRHFLDCNTGYGTRSSYSQVPATHRYFMF